VSALTRTSPSPGRGVGTSTYSSADGPPGRRSRIAFIGFGPGSALSYNRISQNADAAVDLDFYNITRPHPSTRETRAEAGTHVSYAAEDGVANDYATNIQIAELNAITAAIAVVQWKKLLGIYQDTRGQYYTGYSIPSGEIIGEGKK
jgi:hypothetical protein